MAQNHLQTELDELVERASRAAKLLKTLGNEVRLSILCYLSSGEKSVSQLEILLSQRQAAVSQQLARLRLEGIVETRRDGKTIYYRLCEPKIAKLLDTLHDLYCPA